jgi:hypothetical protein
VTKRQRGSSPVTIRPQRRVVATELTLEAAARLGVLLHEAAHPLLHGELDAVQDQQHRGVCETEAESDADVLATFLGLDVERLIGELHRRLVPRPVDRPHRGRRQHPARGRQRRRPVARDGERGRAGA